MHAVLESYTSVVGSLHILNKIKQHNNICGERESLLNYTKMRGKLNGIGRKTNLLLVLNKCKTIHNDI